MSGLEFDHLARLVAVGGSRRQLLRAFAATLASSTAGSLLLSACRGADVLSGSVSGENTRIPKPLTSSAASCSEPSGPNHVVGSIADLERHRNEVGVRCPSGNNRLNDFACTSVQVSCAADWTMPSSPLRDDEYGCISVAVTRVHCEPRNIRMSFTTFTPCPPPCCPDTCSAAIEKFKNDQRVHENNHVELHIRQEVDKANRTLSRSPWARGSFEVCGANKAERKTAANDKAVEVGDRVKSELEKAIATAAGKWDEDEQNQIPLPSSDACVPQSPGKRCSKGKCVDCGDAGTSAVSLNSTSQFSLAEEDCALCCPPEAVCCNGACCAASQVCADGQCTAPPQKIYCNCNKKCYTDVNVCLSECKASLGCFIGICGPAQPGQC
jgi:hypothetical protein